MPRAVVITRKGRGGAKLSKGKLDILILDLHILASDYKMLFWNAVWTRLSLGATSVMVHSRRWVGTWGFEAQPASAASSACPSAEFLDWHRV